MTTILTARAALVTAVGASDRLVDPPACYVYSQGSDMTLLGKGSIQWGFRVSCVVGYRDDDAAASKDLAGLLSAKLIILWALPGWSVDRVSADLVTDIGGGKYFSADIDVTTVVQIV